MIAQRNGHNGCIQIHKSLLLHFPLLNGYAEISEDMQLSLLQLQIVKYTKWETIYFQKF